jgi:murein DD-endopeptidase MepM/ murein hydrolase activator NlpD
MKLIYLLAILMGILWPFDMPVTIPTDVPGEAVNSPTTPPYTANEYIWPLPLNCAVLRPYSQNGDGTPNGYNARDHRGWDISCYENTPVYAIDSGEMSVEGQAGNLTLRVTKGDRTILYGHVKRATASGYVEQGQQIGLLGTHSGPHLHLAIIINGVMVDPINYMPRVWTVAPFGQMNLDDYRLGN